MDPEFMETAMSAELSVVLDVEPFEPPPVLWKGLSFIST